MNENPIGKKLTVVAFSSILPSVGGVASVLTTLAEEAACNGYDIRVVTARPINENNQYIKKLKAKYIPIYALNEDHIFIVKLILDLVAKILGIIILLPYMIFKRMSLTKAWRKVIQELQYDIKERPISRLINRKTHNSLTDLFKNGDVIFHMHFLGWKECFDALSIARKMNITTILHYHNDVAFTQKSSVKKLFNNKNNVMPEKTIIIVLSEDIKRKFKEIAGDTYDIDVIPNLVNDVYTENYGKRAGHGLVTFCSIGRIVGGKGFEDIIRAFALVAEEIKDIKCIIIGNGLGLPYMKDLAARIDVPDLIVFKDEITSREITDILKEIDVFVMASSNEGLPLVMLEAMSLAKPIIATAVGAIGAIIRDADNGIIVEDGHVRELAAAMKLLAYDENLRDKMSMNSRKKYLASFSRGVVWPQLERLYIKLASNLPGLNYE